MVEKYLPLSAIPNQVVSAVINGQNYRVDVRQMGDALFTSVMVDGEYVSNNVIARIGSTVIPWTQTKARTVLYWVDTQGNETPRYLGLGTRWLLCFEEE